MRVSTVDLGDAAAVVADGGDEEGAFGGGSLRDGHWGSFVASPVVVKRREASLRQRGDACGVAFYWHG